MSLIGELQLQNGEAWVELFELDLAALGGPLYRFVPETGAARQPIVWQGNTYNPLPIAAEGFASDGTGRAPRPKLRAANPAGVFSALAAQYGDFVRAKVTRKRTKVKYLDGVNFPARRNLFQYTEDLPSWKAYYMSSSAAQVQTLNPYGGSTASALIENTANASHAVDRYTSFGAAGDFVFSAYLKRNGAARNGRLWLNGTTPSSAHAAHFDLSSGVATIATTTGVASCGMVDAGNGWWRCWIAATMAGIAGPIQRIQAILPNGALGHTGDGASGLLVWGMQLEAGSQMTDYQPVGATWSQNPTADPAACLDDDIFYVTRKSAEFPILELELGSPMELPGVSLPRRQIIANTCAWRYRSGECGYAGGPVANEFDQAVTVLAQDKCSHTVNGCKMRFGANAELPFGGFPGAAKIPR